VRAAGQPATLLALKGGDALEGRPECVREFLDLGVRSIQLVHYRSNELDYVRRLVGIDHVGIGTDMTGLATFTLTRPTRSLRRCRPSSSPAGSPRMSCGSSPSGNFLRVLEAVTTGGG